ncbi:MAG: FixH family protein [Gammaproteobacteria bacterium]
MSPRLKLWTIISVITVCAVAAGFVLFKPLDALFGTPSEGSSGNSENGTFHPAGPFKVQVGVHSSRPRIGKNRLTVVLRDEGNKPVVNARVHALAEMPAMGAMPAMRAPADISETGPGRFEGDFELSMDGAWPLSLAIDSKALGQA